MTTKPNKIVLDYKPRRVFKDYHDSQKRFSCTVAHRRAGKTVARINKLIMAAVYERKPSPRFGYLAPYFVQAKDIAWNYLKYYTSMLEPLGRKINESELSVTFGHNGAVIRLYGAENAERLRGLYFDGIVVDEAQGLPAHVLRTIIMPALSDREGWLDLSGTPKGWDNLLGGVALMARDNPDEWFFQVLRASESGVIPEKELIIQRGLMADNEYEQEYECSFDAAITGAVYGKQMAELEKSGRIISGLYDPTLPVFTAWDLGRKDATAIVFYQVSGKELRVIDYYEAHFDGIKEYCDVLKGKTYKYAAHYVPHDAAQKRLEARGRSIVDQALDEGVQMQVVRSPSDMSNINAARLAMRSTWIDADKCSQLIACLKQYQYNINPNTKTHSLKPIHDWTSHGADAFELMSIVWQEQHITTPVDIMASLPKPITELTMRDVLLANGFEDEYS